ncbi:hypothetical protein K438DRAFT_1976061 [Mycena galopus ATCC 62051]|nr:hypothetical protein K438DRAFT_1976061 [Mycena galopus ATCC 62051]
MPLLLPLELKTLIAEQASRATLANFCATSREEYLYMMPILYRSIVQEVRTVGTPDLRRLAVLLFTLGSTESRRNLGPYPATLVRELRLRSTLGPLSWFEGALQKALRGTAEYAQDGKSKLRTFHWSGDEITIFPLLGERPVFEHLAELSVAQSCSDISEFEFLRIPGLKSLAYKARTPFTDEERTTMCRLCRSLELLLNISPGLTILKLDISCKGTHVPLLEEAINSLWLPCLEAASIDIYLWDDNPDPDFNTFLEAHPTLYNVSVALGGRLLCDDALPLLRKFAGRADDFLKVCDGVRPIQDLAVTLFRDHNEGRAAERARAVVAALTKTPNLRRLAIVNGYDTVYDPTGESCSNGIYALGMDHSTICTIGQACSGITHLELHLKSAKKADLKALANFHELRWIRAHFWITVPNGGGPAANMYDEGFLDTNNSEDKGNDDAYDQARLLLRVFRNHIDLHLIPMAPNLHEVEIAVVVAREQDPDSEDFEESGVELCEAFSLRIVHREGKRLTVRT